MVIAIPKIYKHWASCLIADSPAQAKRMLTMTGKNFDDYVFITTGEIKMGEHMNELFEEMKNDYEIFCRSAQRFMDSVKGQQEIKTDTPDYKSWVGKVVYVWDEDKENKQKAILLDYDPDARYPFRVAGMGFDRAELCEE